MTLERLELLVARAADGLATPEELMELEGGLEAEEQGALLREALALEAGAVDVAADVMAALEPADALLSAFADGQLDVERRELVARRLAAEPGARAQIAAFAQVSAGLSEALAEGRGRVDVWPAVARRLGVDPEAVPGWDGALLREAVVTEAGRVNVTPAVLDAVREPSRARVLTLEVPAWRRWLQSWSLPAFGLATAAALLLSFPASSPDVPGAMSFRVSPVNHVQIEDISTDAPDAMVQVLQFDEDAPTIIFIEEVPAGDEGATL